MIERKFVGECWRELAIVWQLPTYDSNNVKFESEYERIQVFLYTVWKRTVWKKKSYIRTRVANDLRQYTGALAKQEHNIYKYIWEALTYIKDDNELIKITIALVPYMWY